MLFKNKRQVQLWMHHFREVKTTVITFFRSILYKPTINSFDVNDKLITFQGSGGQSENVPQESLTVVSWNIFKGYYGDQLNNSIEYLEDLFEPDIWLLQEAPILEDGQSFLQFKGSNPNESYVSSHKYNGDHLYFPFAHSGQLTHSQFCYSGTEVHLLPQVTDYSSWARSTEYLHRVFLYTQIGAPDGKTIGVYNIHLENMTTPNGRLHQFDFIIEQYHKKNDDYVIMAGDFNTFFTTRFEKIFKLLDSHGFVNFAPKHWRVLPKLDFVFTKGFSKGEITTVRVKGSDHNPIISKLWL